VTADGPSPDPAGPSSATGAAPAPEGVSGTYPGFGGRVGRTFAGSESWWPPRPTPPAGAPDVLVIMCDDLGFSDLGCYGGEIDTPNLDRLAAEGLRYSDFNVTPMCSPTRAALLTGCNSHAVGVGHVAHSDPGFPGYSMELSADCVTIPEVLGDGGYATAMFGKWHLTKDSHCSSAGPKHSWPTQRGFDRFYGILDGFTNLHHPHRLVDDNHAVEVDRYPDDYFFTDDITDRTVAWLRDLSASNPAVPFFCYLAHGAVHAPLHARAETIDRYVERYRVGWDVIRSERHRRVLELGLLPPDTPLPPRNAEPGQEVPAWDDLDARQQELFARYMAVYAAMVDEVDQSVGRLRATLEDLGRWENTLLVFTSDNGASREGEENGTTSYYTHLLGEDDWEADHARLEDIGGPRTIPHYPRGWAMASNTPFRLYKINTHAGGRRVPLVISWPRRIADSAASAATRPGAATGPGSLRHQYVHVTDVLPTLCELIGVPRPDQRGGVALQDLAGVSAAATLDDPGAPSHHHEQYDEMWGHRGYKRGDWEIVTLHQPLTEFGDHEWELYHRIDDPTELHDRAAEHPELVAEMAAAWEAAAWANQVYPLEEGTYLKHILRPPWNEEWSRPVDITPGTPTLERWRSLQLIWARSFVVDVQLGWSPGDQGVLVAHGDQGGGYVLYVEHDRLWFAHNDGHRMRTLDAGPLAAGSPAEPTVPTASTGRSSSSGPPTTPTAPTATTGGSSSSGPANSPTGGAEHTVRLDVTAPGGNTWTVRVLVDGEQRVAGEGFPLFISMAPFEGIDVGIDRRSPVSWDLYDRHGPFPYSGRLERVRYEPGAYAADSPFAMVELLRDIGRKYE
jgi:arylsulfatase A-like enzyme